MTPTMNDKFYRSSFKNYGFTVQKKSAILSFVAHLFIIFFSLIDNIAHQKTDNLNGIMVVTLFRTVFSGSRSMFCLK